MGKREESMGASFLTRAEWDEVIERKHRESEKIADSLFLRDYVSKDATLAPRLVQLGDTVHFMRVELDLDWKLSTRLEMIELARDLITKSYFLDELNPAVSTVIGTIIKGEDLYEHSIGEFFELYGRFEQEHKTRDHTTKAKMMDLVNGDSRYLKDYFERGKMSEHPLPHAVRNILAHKGTNPNTLEKDDIRTSIELLKSWVVL